MDLSPKSSAGKVEVGGTRVRQLIWRILALYPLLIVLSVIVCGMFSFAAGAPILGCVLFALAIWSVWLVMEGNQ